MSQVYKVGYNVNNKITKIYVFIGARIVNLSSDINFHSLLKYPQCTQQLQLITFSHFSHLYSQSSYYGGYSPYYGNSYGTAFEGYKYTHAVVFGFDRRGRLIWDNSFEINDVISYTLEQFVHISISDKEMALLYVYEDEIRSKIIEGNEVMEGKTFNELKLSFEDDVVSKSEDEYGGLEKWYGGNLFAYGILKIKNMKDEGVKLNREVFFINKISYQ